MLEMSGFYSMSCRIILEFMMVIAVRSIEYLAAKVSDAS